MLTKLRSDSQSSKSSNKSKDKVTVYSNLLRTNSSDLLKSKTKINADLPTLTADDPDGALHLPDIATPSSKQHPLKIDSTPPPSIPAPIRDGAATLPISSKKQFSTLQPVAEVVNDSSRSEVKLVDLKRPTGTNLKRKKVKLTIQMDLNDQQGEQSSKRDSRLYNH